jgi:uncharacterized protein (TIGR02246 family)
VAIALPELLQLNEENEMRSGYALMACLLLVLACGCAHQDGNRAADVEAIKEASMAWDNAWNAADADKLASLYTDDAIAMGPNASARVGKDVIRASAKQYFDRFSEENRSVVEDVRISGNLAVARGTQETETSPRVGGDTVRDKANWISVYQRQSDGSWKILWEIFTSDLPQSTSRP